MSIPFGGNDDLAAMFESLGRMMRSGGTQGPVDWEAALTTARAAIGDHVPPSPAQRDTVAQAATIADVWLDAATSFPGSSIGLIAASPREWIEDTFPAWRDVVEPVAAGVASAMAGVLPTDAAAGIPDELLAALPEDMREQLSAQLQTPEFQALTRQLGALARGMGANVYGTQFGTALADMAGEVLSSSDIGVPLAGSSKPMLVLENVERLAAGLGVPTSDLLVYCAVRELAHQRLFAAAPWLGPQLRGALHRFAAGVHIDTHRVQEAMGAIDPSDPQSLQSLLDGNLFNPEPSPDQRIALATLETLLALIEGWVSAVTQHAVDNRIDAAAAIDEAFRRRRAAGGPAERLFGGLVGLQLRPAHVREAAALWLRVTQERGADGREDLWAHPDLLPTAADLADPGSFTAAGGADLMSELSRELESGDD